MHNIYKIRATPTTDIIMMIKTCIFISNLFFFFQNLAELTKVLLFVAKDSTKIDMFGALCDFSLHYAYFMILA